MNCGRDSDEETIIFNPKEVNRHHGSRNSTPKLAFGCHSRNKSQSQVAPVTGQAPFNQLFNQGQKQSVPSVYQQPPLPVPPVYQQPPLPVPPVYQQPPLLVPLVYQQPPLPASSSNVQQQQKVQKQASQVHPGRQQGSLVPQGNLPQHHQYALQSYQQLQAPNSHYSQGALPHRRYYDAHPGATVAMAQMWPATHTAKGFPNTAYTYQNPAGQTETTSMLQITQQKNKCTPQPMHVDNRLSKQHDSGPLSHSNQYERDRNSRYHESHHEERRNKKEFHRQPHKSVEHAFRGFTNRYTCQKLQKNLLVQTEGGLLTFLSLNSQFILKTGWQKEITPRQKVNDCVACSVSVNRQQLMSEESISPEETSLSDTTTEYHRALHSTSPNEQSEEELQGILSSLSQLPDFNMDIEPETGSISNPGREADRATTDGNHYDQEVTRVSNQYDEEPVTSLPSVPESTIVSNSKDVSSPISEEYESESEDDDSSDDDRRRIPSAFCSMGNILRMLNQKAPLTQGGQEAVAGSTMSASSSTAQTKGKSQQTSLGSAIANSTDQVAKNSDITSFVGKLKTCPRPVGAPRKCYKDQATPSSKPVNRNVQTPVSSVQTNSNKYMTPVKKGMLQSFRIPKVKSVLSKSVSSAESTNEPIVLNRNVSTEDEGTEDGDSIRSKWKEDNPSDESSKEFISSASKRVEVKNTDHKLSNQLSKEEGKRKKNEKPPKSKSASGSSRERKNNEIEGRHGRDSSSENKQTPKSKTVFGPSRERKNGENEKGQRRDSSNENTQTPKSKTAFGPSRERKNSETEKGRRRDSSNEDKQTPKSKTAFGPSRERKNSETKGQRRDSSNENKQTPKSKTAFGPSRERKNSENEEGQRRDSSNEKQTPKSKTASGLSRERKNCENEEGQRRDSSNENKQTPKSKTASGRSKSSENEEGLRRNASSETKDNKIKCVSKKKPKDKKEKERGEDRNNKKQKVMDKNHSNSPETENVNNNNNNNNPRETKDREKSLKIDSRRKSEENRNGKRSSSKPKDSTNKKEDNKKPKDTGNSIREVKERQQMNEPSTQPRDKRERRKSSEDSRRERSASGEKLSQSKGVRETTAKRKGLEETEDSVRKKRLTETGVQQASSQESHNPPPFSTQGQGLSIHIDVTSSASTVPDSTTTTSHAQSPIPRPVAGGGPQKNIVTPEKLVPTRNSAKDTSVISRCKGLEETEDSARKKRITESDVQQVSNRESRNPLPFSTQGQELSIHVDVTSSASTIPDSTTTTSHAQSPIPRPVEGGGPPENIVTPEKLMSTRNSAKDTSVSSRRVSDNEVTVKPCPKEESNVTHEPLFKVNVLPIAVTVKSEPLSAEGQPSSAERQSCTHTSIKMEQSTISQSNMIEDNSALTNVSGAVESWHRVETIIPKEFQSIRVPVSSSNIRCRTGASDDVKTSPTDASTPVREPWFEDPSESRESISKTETFESVEETNQVDKEKEKELTSYTKRWLSGLENYQDSGNPYEDLLKKLADMGLDIWEDGGCLMYNWEVNLRWLLTHIFRPIEFATFTRNVKHYMTTYASLPLFFEYITGDISDDLK